MSKLTVKWKNNEYIQLILIYLIINLPQLLMVAIMTPGLATPQDEFSTIYNAAYFAGYDWTAIGKNYSAYYGYGFLMFFVPLFWVVRDGLMIYRIILFCCYLLSLGSCIICYKIVRRSCPYATKTLVFFVSLACTSVKGRYTVGIYNEYMFSLCVWLCFYILLQLCNITNKPRLKAKKTLMLFSVILYSYTVHARAAVLFLIIGIIVCCVLIGYKKLIISIPVSIILTLLFIPFKLFTNYLQINMLGDINGNSSIMKKVSGGLGETIFAYFKGELLIFLGQLHAVNIVTVGAGAVGVAIFAITLLELIREKKIFGNGYTYRNNSQEIQNLVGILFTSMGIIAFAVGMGISAGKGVDLSLSGEGKNINFRYIVLIRYLAPFIGPALMMTFLLLIQSGKERIHNILQISCIYFLIMQLVFIKLIYENIQHTGWGTDICIPFTWDLLENPSDIYLFGGFFIPLYLFVVMYFCINKNNFALVAVILILVGNSEQLYRNIHALEKANSYGNVDAGYQLFKMKENEFKDIYVLDLKHEQNQNFYLYQILLPRNKIIPGVPPDNVNQALLLCNTGDFEEGKEYTIIQLDDNEWLYIKGEKVKNIMQKLSE